MDQIPIHAVCNVYLNNHTLGPAPFAPGIALGVVFDSFYKIDTDNLDDWNLESW